MGRKVERRKGGETPNSRFWLRHWLRRWLQNRLNLPSLGLSYCQRLRCPGGWRNVLVFPCCVYGSSSFLSSIWYSAQLALGYQSVICWRVKGAWHLRLAWQSRDLCHVTKDDPCRRQISATWPISRRRDVVIGGSYFFWGGELKGSWYSWHTASQLVRRSSHDFYLATGSILWRFECTKFVLRRVFLIMLPQTL